MSASINRSVLDQVVRAIEQAHYRLDLEVTLETRLGADLKLGRIGRMKLGICLEEVFAIELSDDVLVRAVTVADIVKYLSRRYDRENDNSCPAEVPDEVIPCPGGLWVGVENWLGRIFGASRLPSYSKPLQMPS